ncbi:protein kinase [Oligoflexia bacterium]|nr:protein kinase [Oligoflexia bacterium]
MGQEGSVHTIGKYKVLGSLGRGSMGVVYKAQDPEIGRLVAIKTLRRITSTRFHDAEAALERFKNEARSAGNLRHPNIITVFDVNVDGDMPYIVMDYVEGESLDLILSKRGRLEIAEVIYYMEQIAGGLQAAHEKRIVHRDIKPSNLILDSDNRVYILDFGVAKINQSFTDSEKTVRAEPVMGTPGYMSPEQVLNEALDIRSDLFSLAIVAYEALTGSRPFPGDNFTEIVGHILNSKPIPITSFAADLPLALEVEFERALARNPNDRFDSAQEMVEAFKRSVGSIESNVFDPHVGNKSGGVVRSRKPSQWKSLAGKTEWESDLAQFKKDPSVELVNAWSAQYSSEPMAGPFSGPQPEHEKELRTGPGQLFSHVDQYFAKGGRFSSQRLSLIRVFTVVFALSCILLGGGIIILMLENELGEFVGFKSDKDRVQVVKQVIKHSPISYPALEALVPTDADPVPTGKLVTEMTDREVLGVLLSDEVSEAMTLGALNEAKMRSISKFVEASVKALDDDSYIVRIATVKLLAEIGDKRIVPKLVTKLDDHDPLVRKHVANALGTLGSRSAIAYLNARYMKEDVSGVKLTIKQAIEQITGYPMKK